VAGGVIVVEQRSLLGQRARQVGIGGGIAEGRGVVLVLEHDHEHVADRRQLEASGGRAGRGPGEDQGRASGASATGRRDGVAAATEEVRVA
jgi:hypothetical protein